MRTNTKRESPLSASSEQTRVGLAIATLATVVACWIHRPWKLDYTVEGAHFAYLAEMLAQGIAPYRDLFSIHGPVHTWLGAIAVRIGGETGLVVLGMVTFWLMSFVAVALALRAAGRSRDYRVLVAVALVAWGLSTGWSYIGMYIVSGSRPKLLAVTFASLAVLLLSARKPALAGASFAAACWTWQPSFAIAVGSVVGWIVACLREESRKNFRPILEWVGWVALGVAAFSVATVIALALQGSLGDFFDQGVWFALETQLDWVKVDSEHGTLSFWTRLAQTLPVPVMVVGGVGLVGYLLSPIRKAVPEPTALSRFEPIGFAMVGWFTTYLAYLSFDFDARGDTVGLLTPLAVFSGVVVSQVGRAGYETGRLVIAAALCFWILAEDTVFPIYDSSNAYRLGRRMEKETVIATVELARGRGVLIFADPLLQKNIGERPKHPYLFWEPGTIEYIGDHHEGGVTGFLDRLVAQRYGVVVIRPRAKKLIPYLEMKLREDYTRIQSSPQRGTWVLR